MGMVQDSLRTCKIMAETCADHGRLGNDTTVKAVDNVIFPTMMWTETLYSFRIKAIVSHTDDDYENTIYAEFSRLSNFIGYNYCEQFWGFESEDFPIKTNRDIAFPLKLLKLCNKYGAILT